MTINPIKLNGPWDEGYALDIHTTTKRYMEDNVYGYPIVETEYTDLGKLLHYLKYRNDISKLDDIIKHAEQFIKSWDAIKQIDLVIPAPPSKHKDFQAALEIAKAIAELINVSYSDEILQQDSIDESANESSNENKKINGTIYKGLVKKKECNILLVDDFYDSGSTLTECVRILRQDSKIKKIYVLTITKMRHS